MLPYLAGDTWGGFGSTTVGGQVMLTPPARHTDSCPHGGDVAVATHSPLTLQWCPGPALVPGGVPRPCQQVSGQGHGPVCQHGAGGNGPGKWHGAEADGGTVEESGDTERERTAPTGGKTAFILHFSPQACVLLPSVCVAAGEPEGTPRSPKPVRRRQQQTPSVLYGGVRGTELEPPALLLLH